MKIPLRLILTVPVIALLLVIDVKAGLATLALTTLAIVLTPRLQSRTSFNDEVAESRARLSERITVALSGNVEAKIFNYADRVQDQLQASEAELSSREESLISRSGIASAFTHLILGSNIIISSIFAILSAEAGPISAFNVALITLSPLLIFFLTYEPLGRKKTNEA